jgi:predicted benzoate:H+ symporter BenE
MIKILTYIVSTVLTYVLGIVSKKKGWNESIPIPVQNIMVGAIVFLISAIAIKLSNQEVILEDIIQQVFFSLGGSGTATLYYDTKKED